MNRMVTKNEKTTKEAIEMKRNVVNEPSLTPERESGYIALYEALVPDNKLLEINLPMIYNEAFEAFENTIGLNEQELEIIKAHFGISGQKRKVGEARISVLLKKFRTIENAAHYISGYKNLIENIAGKMKGAPYKTPEIVKAKLLIMYFMFFCQSYFFPDEFTVTMSGKPAINKCAVEKKKNRDIYPEYMFVLYMSLINRHEKRSLVYDMIVNELKMLEPKLQSEILSFVELRREGKKFISVNKACSDVSFENARRLKKLANPVPMVIEADKLADFYNIKLFRFQPMYEIYKLLKTRPLESFEKIKLEKVFVDNHNVVVRTIEAYEIIKDFEVSSQTEANRIIFMFEYASKKGFTMKAKEVPRGNKPAKDFNCVFGSHIAAFEFSRKEGYLTESSSLEEEFKIANEIIERADKKIWLGYLNQIISHEELKALLQIDKKFEEEVLGFKRPETTMETVVRFATEAGYLKEENLPDEEFIKKVIIENNESSIAKFSVGEISEESFKKKIGFEEKFAEMYFDSKKVDMTAIEAKLLELKKNRAGKAEMRRSALLIKLYCYIVQNNVKCGPKGKAPKGNKSLKPQNLLAMIA